MNARRTWLLGLALLWSSDQVIAQQCHFPYETTNVGPYLSRSPEGACSAAAGEFGEGAMVSSCSVTGDETVGASSGTCYMMVGESGPYACNVHQSITEPCPPPPPPEDNPCEDDGKSQWTVTPNNANGVAWCEGSCKITAGGCEGIGPAINGNPTGGFTCLLKWSTDEDCNPNQAGDDDGDGDVDDDGGDSDGDGDGSGDEPPNEPDNGGEPSDSPGEKCMAVGDGEYCKSPEGDGNCGYVNDSYTCLDKIKDDECHTNGDGSRVCGDGAKTTPPVPDSGTPGDLAEPDGELIGTSGNVTNVYNYYNSGTVAGSSRDPGTTGASGASTSGSPHAPVPGQAGSGGGNGTGGDGTCEGTECAAGEIADLEDIGSMTDAFTDFWGDLQEVPIIAAASGIAPSFGGGSCPDWSTTVALYSASIDIDFTSICGLWAGIAPVLTIVCLVMFGLLAFRVLFSA